MNFLMAPRYRIYRHLVLISFMGMICYNLAHFTFYEHQDFFHREIRIECIGSIILFFGTIYLNIYVLIPRLMLKRKYGLYSLVLVLLISGLTLMLFSFDYWMYKINGIEFGQYSFFYKNRILPLEIVSNFFLYMICCIGPAMFTLLRHWLEHERRTSELKKENLQSELERLKNQVSPQFLLNTLSEASRVVVSDSRQASTILVQLGKLLRYQLYDSNREKVLLSADLSFLENFLNMEKVLYPTLDFTITKEGPVNFVLIPPLLFIPFVEYFIRQGMQNEGKHYIRLSFRVKEGGISFSCISSAIRREASGLDNIRRRLELLYGKYSLEETQGETENKISMYLTL